MTTMQIEHLDRDVLMDTAQQTQLMNLSKTYNWIHRDLSTNAETHKNINMHLSVTGNSVWLLYSLEMK